MFRNRGVSRPIRVIGRAVGRARQFVLRQKPSYRITVTRAALSSFLAGLTAQYNSIYAVALGARASAPLEWQRDGAPVDMFRVAPWCAVLDSGYYDDFDRRYELPDSLHRFVAGLGNREFTAEQARRHGVPKQALLDAEEAGHIIRIRML